MMSEPSNHVLAVLYVVPVYGDFALTQFLREDYDIKILADFQPERETAMAPKSAVAFYYATFARNAGGVKSFNLRNITSTSGLYYLRGKVVGYADILADYAGNPELLSRLASMPDDQMVLLPSGASCRFVEGRDVMMNSYG